MSHRIHLALACAALLSGCGDKLADSRAQAARAHADKAEAAIKAGDWSRALVAAEQASNYDPLDPKMRDLVTRVRLTALATAPQAVSVDRPVEIDYQAETMLERDPANAHVYRTARGYLALAKGDDKAAEELFQGVVSQKPQWAPAQAALAQVFVRQAKAEQATAAYEAALKADPENALALTGLGRILADKGEKDRAAELLTKALKTVDTAAVRLSLASALWGGPRQNEAGEHLKKAVELEPKSGEAHRRLGEFLFVSNDVEGAAREFSTASQLGAEPLATFGTGLVLEARGQHAEAARHFEAVFNADPRLAIAAYKAGVNHDVAGSAKQAASFFTRFLQAAGQDPAERDRVADASARLERLAAGAQAAAEAPK